MTTENEQRTDLAIQLEEGQTIQSLSETLLDISHMYASIGKTLTALEHTTIDGESTIEIDAELQAQSNKRLLPDTELDMLRNNALPMSEEDIAELAEISKRQNSLQYRMQQLGSSAKTLAEIRGATIRVAYRLVRYMTHVRGLKGNAIGIPLVMSMSASNSQLDLYTMPIPYDPVVGWTRGLTAVRNLLAQSDNQGYQYSYMIAGGYYKTQGMSILPPPLHDGYYPQDAEPLWDYRRRAYQPEDYQADRDGPLAIYLNIMELLVRHLGIGDDDIEEQAAVTALLNPKIARLTWPCRDDIETFEESVLLPYIGRVMVAKSQDNAIDELKKAMGLTHTEALDLVETYKTYSQNVNVFDPERQRSVMISRLEHLAQECGDAGMVTTQLNTHKVIMQTLGLTRHDEDSNVDRRQALGSALEAEIVGKAKSEIIVTGDGQ